MLTKLLKKAIPKPVHPPIRRAVHFFIPPLQRRVRRTSRSYNRLKRRLRRLRLNPILRRRLEQRIWLRIGRLLLWDRRRGNRAIETADQIHLVCPLLSHRGGGPQRALHLFDELKNHREVFLWSEQSLWSEREPDPAFSERYPVKSIVPERFEFPKTGTLVFVSSYFPVGPWVRYTSPRRIVLIHNNNTMTPRDFRRKLRQLSNGGRREVEVMYASELTKRLAGNYPGLVQASLIDLEKFVPAPTKESSDPTSSNAFTVGRLSRANPKKHHSDDPALYRRLVEEGCRVRIMGASPALEAELEGVESVTLLPMGAQEAHLFLQGLDCFFYRTSEGWSEPSGRVVTEAMACGLPVVCHESGGYAQWIDNGRNGFLFESQQEALGILLGLKEDPVLRERVGEAARRTAEELFSDVVRSEIVEFYLR